MLCWYYAHFTTCMHTQTDTHTHTCMDDCTFTLDAYVNVKHASANTNTFVAQFTETLLNRPAIVHRS